MLGNPNGKMWKETQVNPCPLRWCWRNVVKLTIIKVFSYFLILRAINISIIKGKWLNTSPVLSKSKQKHFYYETRLQKKWKSFDDFESSFPAPKGRRALHRKQPLLLQLRQTHLKEDYWAVCLLLRQLLVPDSSTALESNVVVENHLSLDLAGRTHIEQDSKPRNQPPHTALMMKSHLLKSSGTRSRISQSPWFQTVPRCISN